jgi:hypothetical protein
MTISIFRAKYLESQKISLVFSDGAEGVFDLAAYLAKKSGPLLVPLCDESYARRVFVEAGALAWPNGLEIAPLRIYESTTFMKRAA